MPQKNPYRKYLRDPAKLPAVTSPESPRTRGEIQKEASALAREWDYSFGREVFVRLGFAAAPYFGTAEFLELLSEKVGYVRMDVLEDLEQASGASPLKSKYALAARLLATSLPGEEIYEILKALDIEGGYW